MENNIEEYKRFIYELSGRVEALLCTPPELQHERIVRLHTRIRDAISFIIEQDKKDKDGK